MIYIILAAQTGAFLIPMVVMLAIPLTVLGVMPGFFWLNGLAGAPVAGYADPVFFTATAMIGMIALSGFVARDSIILVDFMDLAVAPRSAVGRCNMGKPRHPPATAFIDGGICDAVSNPYCARPNFFGFGLVAYSWSNWFRRYLPCL